MHLRNTLKSFGQIHRTTRSGGITQIRCVGLPVQAKVPVEDMSTKIAAARAWLGDRHLLHYPQTRIHP